MQRPYRVADPSGEQRAVWSQRKRPQVLRPGIEHGEPPAIARTPGDHPPGRGAGREHLPPTVATRGDRQHPRVIVANPRVKGADKPATGRVPQPAPPVLATGRQEAAVRTEHCRHGFQPSTPDVGAGSSDRVATTYRR